MENKDCLRMEYIGLDVKIVTDNRIHHGIIVNETKNTIQIQEKSKIKTILKKQAVLEIVDTKIEGKVINTKENKIKFWLKE